MGRYVAKRLLQFVIIFFAVSIVIFFLVRLSPVDPISVIVGTRQTSPEVIANLKAKFNLDMPVWQQYLTWVGGVLRGDLGIGYKYQQPITQLMAGRMSVTLGLVIISSLLSILLALPLGILCAMRGNSFVDKLISYLSLVCVSAPPFLLSIVIVLIITKVAPTFPFTGSFNSLGTYLQRLILPAIAMSFSYFPLLLRVTRSSMIAALQQPYMLTQQSKGMPASTNLFRHALKNAIIPVISIAGLQVGTAIVGSVLVENVFSLAGLGTLLVDSIKASDYAVVQSITLLLVTVFLFISMVSDVVYAAIDPRIRTTQ